MYTFHRYSTRTPGTIKKKRKGNNVEAVISLYGIFGGIGYLINDTIGMVYGIVIISCIILYVSFRSA